MCAVLKWPRGIKLSVEQFQGCELVVVVQHFPVSFMQ
jgi:hypothetical protein